MLSLYVCVRACACLRVCVIIIIFFLCTCVCVYVSEHLYMLVLVNDIPQSYGLYLFIKRTCVGQTDIVSRHTKLCLTQREKYTAQVYDLNFNVYIGYVFICMLVNLREKGRRKSDICICSFSTQKYRLS